MTLKLPQLEYRGSLVTCGEFKQQIYTLPSVSLPTPASRGEICAIYPAAVSEGAGGSRQAQAGLPTIQNALETELYRCPRAFDAITTRFIMKTVTTEQRDNLQTPYPPLAQETESRGVSGIRICHRLSLR